MHEKCFRRILDLDDFGATPRVVKSYIYSCITRQKKPKKKKQIKKINFHKCINITAIRYFKWQWQSHRNQIHPTIQLREWLKSANICRVSQSSSGSHYMHEIHFWYWNIDRCGFLRLEEIAAGRVLTVTAGGYYWMPTHYISFMQKSQNRLICQFGHWLLNCDAHTLEPCAKMQWRLAMLPYARRWLEIISSSHLSKAIWSYFISSLNQVYAARCCL